MFCLKLGHASVPQDLLQWTQELPSLFKSKQTILTTLAIHNRHMALNDQYKSHFACIRYSCLLKELNPGNLEILAQIQPMNYISNAKI